MVNGPFYVAYTLILGYIAYCEAGFTAMPVKLRGRSEMSGPFLLEDI
jgi:hypothetical protein